MLLVVDLLRQLLDRLLHLLVLTFLAELVEDELLVDVHLSSWPRFIIRLPALAGAKRRVVLSAGTGGIPWRDEDEERAEETRPHLRGRRLHLRLVGGVHSLR